MQMQTPPVRIKTIRSHVGLAREMSEWGEDIIGKVNPLLLPRTPYHYSPWNYAYAKGDRAVVSCETSHKVYEIFDVTDCLLPLEEDDLN